MRCSPRMVLQRAEPLESLSSFVDGFNMTSNLAFSPTTNPASAKGTIACSLHVMNCTFKDHYFITPRAQNNRQKGPKST